LLALLAVEFWSAAGMISEDFSLELLRGSAVPAGGADGRGSLNCHTTVPAAVAAAVVANQLFNILQVAPLLPCAVSRFAVSVGPAIFVNKDLAVTLAETIFDGESCWGSNTHFECLSERPNGHHGSEQI